MDCSDGMFDDEVVLAYMEEVGDDCSDGLFDDEVVLAYME